MQILRTLYGAVTVFGSASAVFKQENSSGWTEGKFHPDYTVGPGVSPGQPWQVPARPPYSCPGSRTVPPVGNSHPGIMYSIPHESPDPEEFSFCTCAIIIPIPVKIKREIRNKSGYGKPQVVTAFPV